MLRQHGIEIDDDEPVERGKRYEIPRPAPKERAKTGGPNIGRLRTDKRVHSRFGQLLAEKRIREGRDWWYVEVAQATGLHEHTVRVYAIDKVSRFELRAVDALCTFAGCTIAHLLAIEEEAGR